MAPPRSERTTVSARRRMQPPADPPEDFVTLRGRGRLPMCRHRGGHITVDVVRHDASTQDVQTSISAPPQDVQASTSAPPQDVQAFTSAHRPLRPQTSTFAHRPSRPQTSTSAHQPSRPQTSTFTRSRPQTSISAHQPSRPQTSTSTTAQDVQASTSLAAHTPKSGGIHATRSIHHQHFMAVKSPNLDYSHFVSLPLAFHPNLVEKLVNFQNSILGNCDPNPDENLGSDSNEDTSDDEDKGRQKGDFGIDKSIFIKPKTFHLTVLMLKLWNKDRVDAAADVLRSVSSKVMGALDGRPVSVKLKGLDCMKGSLEKARVLYAPVEEVGSEDRLLRACQVIIDAYVEAGLVLEKDAKQKLKLHATVMNARHRKRTKRSTGKLDSFNAQGIVKQYGSEEWGEYLIREAHLSQRFVFDENGYYHCCASIPFPRKHGIRATLLH